MRKICLMSGAFLNAGDFLIEQRSLNLIKHFIPNSDVTVLKRVQENYTDKIDMLNQFDAIIFAGGPIYQPKIYPNGIPFINKEALGGVKSPIFFIGGGAREDVYFQKISDESRLFFNMGIVNGVSLGCRDIYTYRFLKHQGYQNVMMTGCPAWYDLNYINREPGTSSFGKNIRKICVSEPANAKNIPFLRELILHLYKKYSGAKICLINHRELKQGVQKLVEEMKCLSNFSFSNISGSAEGFRQYDDCDLHVGFRVHAHIYNLSRRQYSILINEDIRGRGVNHALGLENIDISRPSFREKKLLGRFYLTLYNNPKTSVAESIIHHVDDCIEYSEMVDYTNFGEAFRKMHLYYGNMEKHFLQISNCLH